MKSILATLFLLLSKMSPQEGAFSPLPQHGALRSSHPNEQLQQQQQQRRRLVQNGGTGGYGYSDQNYLQYGYTSRNRQQQRSYSLIPVNDSEWMPLYLSGLAGASTCLGAAIVFLQPSDQTISPSLLSFSLSLAASVMITVSVVSLGPECLFHGGHLIPLWSIMFLQRVLSFAFGCLVYKLLSYFTFPEPDELVLELDGGGDVENDLRKQASNHDERRWQQQQQQQQGYDNVQQTPSCHSTRSAHPTPQHSMVKTIRSRRMTPSSQPSSFLDSPNSFDSTEGAAGTTTFVRTETQQEEQKVPLISHMPSSFSEWSNGDDLPLEQKRAWRVAMLLLVSLLIHNFPEGLAVAASALESTKLGMTVAFGIMVHNIPEGIAIAVPCLAARPNQPWLAFALASGSGLAEPLGASVALLFLRHQDRLEMDNVLAFVAGIMISVAVWELLPEAKRQESPPSFVAGTLIGMLVMVATECYLPS